MCLLDHNPPLCWISNCRCCQKLRKGAMPVPGPTRIQGTWGFWGRWKLGALDKEGRVRRLVELKSDQELLDLEIQQFLIRFELSNSTVKQLSSNLKKKKKEKPC